MGRDQKVAMGKGKGRKKGVRMCVYQVHTRDVNAVYCTHVLIKRKEGKGAI